MAVDVRYVLRVKNKEFSCKRCYFITYYLRKLLIVCSVIEKVGGHGQFSRPAEGGKCISGVEFSKTILYQLFSVCVSCWHRGFPHSPLVNPSVFTLSVCYLSVDLVAAINKHV